MSASKRNCIILVVLPVLANVSNTIANSNDIVINEILALNDQQMSDPAEPDEYPDWIELYNSSENEINLSNMYLSDNKDNLTKWKIPENIKIAGHGFLLFFADDDVEQGPNHTNFKLSGAGEIVVLIDTDGKTIIDSLSYGIQTDDVSYGRFPDGSDTFNFFDTPTPGQKNSNGYIDNVANVQFDYQRGFYDHPLMLTLSTSTDSAKIYYTIDGIEPLNEASDGTFLYLSPISINKTTCVRAKATLSGWKTSDIVTHTYIFLDNVIRQPARPDGFPANWGHTGAGDYEMDPDVVDDPKYSSTIKNDMKAIPTVSLVMDVDDWFGENDRGIYLEGELDERAVSAELIHPDGAEGFQIDCAVMIFGGSSVNRWKADKLSMRLKFQKAYGPASLDYPLFGEEATDKFETVVLDARLNMSWAYGGTVSPERQRERAQYTRDQFVADIQNELGGYAPHGRHVHLYLNGLYWGMYWLHERPDEHFAVAYFGGDEDNYDVIKHNDDTIVRGSNQAYLQMLSMAENGLSTAAGFSSIQQLLDIPNFIDYMILNFYVGNTDWAQRNWYASRHRTDPSHLWRYHSWDAEHVMKRLNENATDKNNEGGPTFLHQKLSENAEYRMMFADRVYQLFFNNGLLTPARSKELYQIRLDDVDRAVVCESARWGDNRRDVPYTRDVEWVAQRDWLLNTYLEQRTEIVLNQFKQRGLYPSSVNPPVYFINDTEQSGGKIDKGDKLGMEASNDTIYFTMDGTDPLGRDDISSGAIKYDNPIELNESVKIRARATRNNQWSALHEADFLIQEDLSDLKITEIHYHPLAEGNVDHRKFEFIELRNISASALDLSLCQFIDGVSYTFPSNTKLNAGGYIVLASDSEYFKQRYQQTAFGQFTGNLDNAGEKLILIDALNDTLISLRYDDESPWPSEADGDGYSLTSKNAYPQGDPNNASYWVVSSQIHGSPGGEDPVLDVEQNSYNVIKEFSLQQNYPNPFNSITKIDYSIHYAGPVKITVFDITGRSVRTLLNEHQPGGNYSVIWDGKNSIGNEVSSGIYFVQLKAGDILLTNKMVLIK